MAQIGPSRVPWPAPGGMSACPDAASEELAMPFLYLPPQAGLVAAILAVTALPAAAAEPGEWPAYGRTGLGDRHSPLTRIDRANVGRLAVAWRYHTGETGPVAKGTRPPRLSATPIVIGGRFYFSTPLGRVIALDAATGRIGRKQATAPGCPFEANSTLGPET